MGIKPRYWVLCDEWSDPKGVLTAHIDRCRCNPRLVYGCPPEVAPWASKMPKSLRSLVIACVFLPYFGSTYRPCMVAWGAHGGMGEGTMTGTICRAIARGASVAAFGEFTRSRLRGGVTELTPERDVDAVPVDGVCEMEMWRKSGICIVLH